MGQKITMDFNVIKVDTSKILEVSILNKCKFNVCVPEMFPIEKILKLYKIDNKDNTEVILLDELNKFYYIGRNDFSPSVKKYQEMICRFIENQDNLNSVYFNSIKCLSLYMNKKKNYIYYIDISFLKPGVYLINLNNKSNNITCNLKNYQLFNIKDISVINDTIIIK